ncbi:MAG: peptidylprolyl isomerase [bacterium]|nr:peptidylprolyl isomerase [bacterium]
MDVQEKVAVKMETARGTIELELYSKVAPKTVLNFISLAQKGYYDGTKFHRVVDDFVIQGGDPLSRTDDPRVGTGGPGYMFEDEINPKVLGVPAEVITQYEAAGYKYDYNLKSLPNMVGAISMANAGPNTNGSQFFIITTKDQPFLNGKHTVFGKVTKGMDVVLKIKQGDLVKKVTVSL